MFRGWGEAILPSKNKRQSNPTDDEEGDEDVKDQDLGDGEEEAEADEDPVTFMMGVSGLGA